jgi:hypothetical protein
MHRTFDGWLFAIALACWVNGVAGPGRTRGWPRLCTDRAGTDDRQSRQDRSDRILFVRLSALQRLPPDCRQVVRRIAQRRRFQRVPVSFGRPQWASLARLFYALEATGDLARLDGAVFDALHKAGSKLYDDKSILEWVKGQGVGREIHRRLQLLRGRQQGQARRPDGPGLQDPGRSGDGRRRQVPGHRQGNQGLSRLAATDGPGHRQGTQRSEQEVSDRGAAEAPHCCARRQSVPADDGALRELSFPCSRSSSPAPRPASAGHWPNTMQRRGTARALRAPR